MRLNKKCRGVFIYVLGVFLEITRGQMFARGGSFLGNSFHLNPTEICYSPNIFAHFLGENFEYT